MLLAAPAYADADWQPVAFVSSTLGNNAGRLCLGAPGTSRPSDLGCPTYAPYVSATSGYVGIGTSAPGAKLDVNGQLNASSILVSNSVAGNSQISYLNTSNYFSVSNSGVTVFRRHNGSANYTEQMRIDGATGNVGIGTSSPGTTLYVNGTTTTGGLLTTWI